MGYGVNGPGKIQPQIIGEISMDIEAFLFCDLATDQFAKPNILGDFDAIPAPKSDYLNQIKGLTRKNGSLLIFDETITGFRYGKRGAQEHFNVIPDLTTFGKGLAPL